MSGFRKFLATYLVINVPITAGLVFLGAAGPFSMMLDFTVLCLFLVGDWKSGDPHMEREDL